MWMKSVAVGKEKGLWNPGASHFVLHFSSSSLPLLYSEQKEQAVRLVDKAIIIAQRLLDSNHMMLADYLSIQGALLSDPLPSKPVFEQCLDIKTQHLPMDHPNILLSMQYLAWTLMVWSTLEGTRDDVELWSQVAERARWLKSLPGLLISGLYGLICACDVEEKRCMLLIQRCDYIIPICHPLSH